MPPEDAVQMINFFPETSYVRVRGIDRVVTISTQFELY